MAVAVAVAESKWGCTMEIIRNVMANKGILREMVMRLAIVTGGNVGKEVKEFLVGPGDGGEGVDFSM